MSSILTSFDEEIIFFDQLVCIVLEFVRSFLIEHKVKDRLDLRPIFWIDIMTVVV